MVDFDSDTLRYKARERYAAGWGMVTQSLWLNDTIHVENNQHERKTWGSADSGLIDIVRKEHWFEMERTDLW